MLDEYGNLLWHHIKEASTTTCCIAGAVSVLVFYRLVIKTKYNKLPPGPTGLPIIGNLAALRNEGLLEKLNEWQKEYGDIFTIRLGLMRTVVINDANILHEAFVTKSAAFSDRPFFFSLDAFTQGSKTITLASTGDTWKYQRKVASQSLRQYLTGTQFEERCHEVVMHMGKTLEAVQGPVSMKDILSLGTFNVLHGLCFGSIKEFDDPEFKKIYAIFNTVFTGVGNGFPEDVIPFLRYWPTKKFIRISKEFEFFIAYLQKKFDERKTDLDKAFPRCLADSVHLVQQQLMESDRASIVHMTDVHATFIIADVIGAGQDGICATLEWFFILMVTYPAIQARIHEEIDDVVGGKLPGREHRAKLAYTEAVILETMRLYAVAALGVPHYTKTGGTVGGYDIPANTTVMINQHYVLRNPTHWDDPLAFKPERFLSEDQSRVMVPNRIFVPFSVGPRACIGETLSKQQIVYLAVGMLQKYSFSLPPGMKADFTPDTSFFGYRPGDCEVLVTPR